MSNTPRTEMPDGLVAVVKRDCPTCVSVAPVLSALAADGELTVYSQDDPAFPESVNVVDDTDLAFSWAHDIETVPTLIRVENGAEVARTVGWLRPEWESLTGASGLGEGLAELLPGCGSRSVDPDMVTTLAVRYGGETMRSRRVELATLEDEFEAMYARGWSDGLPLVPPTAERVMRMLEGTSRAPDEVIAVAPPELEPVTVEKVAVNAVMAGCLPEYLPVVITAIEAACTDGFNMHGLLCTLWFSGPILIVNGPIAERIGMNSGHNALGQGNRANSTIGRAFQLVIRNVGGGRPGSDGIDRSALGSPGKLGFAFAEAEQASAWDSLASERGFAAGADTVTLFAGHGPIPVMDQVSRTPESLARSLAGGFRALQHHKLAGVDAMLVISPEHQRVFSDAGWSKQRFRDELDHLLAIPGAEMVKGAGSIEEGMDAKYTDRTLHKLRKGMPLIVFAGGGAGAFSAILGGWVGGRIGSNPVTAEIIP